MSDAPVGRGLAMPDPARSGSGSSGPLGYLLDAVRVRPAGKRALSALSALLMLVGGGLFAFPLVSDVYAERVVQTRLSEEFTQPDLRQAYAEKSVDTGDPLTRIVIPDLDLESLVVEGTNMAALRAGAGHYPTTPLPGEDGNVAIAGHRTTYGKPFNRLHELTAGAEIQLETPLATHTYKVVKPPDEHNGRPCDGAACWITHPGDWSVIESTDDAVLTLTTCHPKGSARQRLIVRAELVDTAPASADGSQT